MIRKYEERVLLLVTESCFSNCQYCFRQDILSEGKSVKKSLDAEDVGKIVAFLKRNPEISEAILSGGDPMTLDVRNLEMIFKRLSEETPVKSFRLHTRSVAYDPKSLTAEKIDLLAKYDVRLVFHIVHPYEICDTVEKKIREIRAKGIRMYNQFPLLRGINDHHQVLIEHLGKLDEL